LGAIVACTTRPVTLAQDNDLESTGNIMRVILTRDRRWAFTLVEIMIVVAIIGLLAAVAVPNLLKARKSAQRQACINNLKTIEGAKGIWALEMKKGDADVPSDADLFGPDRTIASKPSCPAGGTYNLGAVNERPSCSVADHKPEDWK
jgi:prepilin-type N-terminal cleavage/methylation domain-containing protein